MMFIDGRDQPSTTVSWPTMGDTRKTAAAPRTRWTKPQLPGLKTRSKPNRRACAALVVVRG